MPFPTYDIATEFLRRSKKLDYGNSFELAQLASQLIADPEKEKLGRDLVIRVKDKIASQQVEISTIPIWNELIVAAGLYPYADTETLYPGSLIRQEFHKSPYLPDIFLHEEQLQVSLTLLNQQSVILSAPTSFGKSLLIEEVVASKLYRNIVIIQPTLALLDETRKKLLKYKDHYKVIVSTSQEPSDTSANIFLFTGERVVEYAKFPAIDFFVIDEFYKLSMEREDDRAVVLNHALYRLLKHTKKFYMLGPSIKAIPESVIEKLGATWQRTDFATVAVDEQMILTKGKASKKADRKEELYDLLNRTTEPTLIYVGAPASCTDLALRYIKQSPNLKKRKTPLEVTEMTEWISEHIHNKWDLIEALSHGIAFHHGGLPRHLGSSIVDAFNRGYIQFLFCTATLIEGVNTSAKNVILFDKKKGSKPIDFFDYKNIAGRSGRMKRHYIGNVIRFEKEPPQLEFEVDIPILSQDNAPLEILLGMDSEDVKPTVKSKLDGFRALPEELQQLLKQHATVDVEGQQKIIAEIESNVRGYHAQLSWNNPFPTYDQLAAVITLAWDNIAKPEDKRTRIDKMGALSARWLASFAFGYNKFGSLGALINDVVNSKFWIDKILDQQERVNQAAFSILHISRSYFDYKLPKWISVVNGIQQYVFTKAGLIPGNYAPFASRLENGFLDPALASLREYDIPLSALRKLGQLLQNYHTPEQNIRNINRLTNTELKNRGLLDYEIRKIRDSI